MAAARAATGEKDGGEVSTLKMFLRAWLTGAAVIVVTVAALALLAWGCPEDKKARKEPTRAQKIAAGVFLAVVIPTAVGIWFMGDAPDDDEARP